MVRSTCLLALLACIVTMLVHGAPVASHDTTTPSDKKDLGKRAPCDEGFTQLPLVGCVPEAADAIRNVFGPSAGASAPPPEPPADTDTPPPTDKAAGACGGKSMDALGYCIGPLGN